ncbi:DUF6415 family natural product biosynthesis protein [Streptomyces tirandamycinicus]|uniref:DUF6415 family natural product biosynthesis protein n=1 Tax=Streptomyces tirandamycinicus TaxID=2174846 RepID=UPI001AC0079E|nr:DUF6415 family natural product biosynthesis protein [Streptomyces tirandamycinicus]
MTGTDAERGSAELAASTPEMWPVDVVEMRNATAQALAPDAEAPAGEGLETLTGLFEGNIRLLIPEVEKAAGRLPTAAIPRACALACCGEAQSRLGPRGISSDPVAQVRRLARSVDALLDHLEALRLPLHNQPTTPRRAGAEKETARG